LTTRAVTGVGYELNAESGAGRIKELVERLVASGE
jgi:hypothetical protein